MLKYEAMRATGSSDGFNIDINYTEARSLPCQQANVNKLEYYPLKELQLL